MDLRVEEVYFLRRLPLSHFQSRWVLFPSKTATKLEGSVLHSRTNALRLYLKLLKAKLLLCYRQAKCCHMLVCGRLPVSDEQVRNKTLRKWAIRNNLQPAANQAGTIVPMEHIAVKTSEICLSRVPKSGQALGDRTRGQMLKSLIMAGL